MLYQKVTLRCLKADNPPPPEEGERTYRLDGLVDSIETVEYVGAVFPEIHYTDRTAMVAVRDFDSGVVHYHFGVMDVTVDPLGGKSQAEVASSPMRRG